VPWVVLRYEHHHDMYAAATTAAVPIVAAASMQFATFPCLHSMALGPHLQMV
jgi:hypothetical protein